METAQPNATRKQIVEAALAEMSEADFETVTTCAIAERANVSQELLSGHFESKEAVWRAVADHLFAMHKDWIDETVSAIESSDSSEQRREFIRQMVYFHAAHPEFLRFVLEHGDTGTERSRWLSETHLRPFYQDFARLFGDIPGADLPHAFYALAGACIPIFSAPGMCQRTTGINPRSNAAIKRHADYLANLVAPK